MTTDRQIASPYMEWAKTRSQARYSLATSGIANVMMNEFPFRVEDLEITSPGGYGYGELLQRLSNKTGAPTECIVQANGTSMANYLAMAACIEPGDEVLIEAPAYELLINAASSLGAKINRFERRFENDFALDPAEVKKAITPRTRLVIITNLHNPSGVLASNEALAEIGGIARQANARVLVDEVYLDMVTPRPPATSFLLDPLVFIVTSSLTKVYGLSGLRCGWILADAKLAQRMWRLRDLMDASVSHVMERMSVVALGQLSRFEKRARDLLVTNRPLVDAFLDSHTELAVVRPLFGTIVFPRLPRDDADDFCALLRQKYETTVVPGRFFEMPRHFRLGLGGNTADLQEGLTRLGAALHDWS